MECLLDCWTATLHAVKVDKAKKAQKNGMNL